MTALPRFDDSVALAPNWKAVLAADAAVGLVGAAVGLIVLVVSNIVLGALFLAVAAAYLVVVARRARLWARLRHEAGL